MKNVFTFGRRILPCSIKPNNVVIEVPMRWTEIARDGKQMLLLSENVINWGSFHYSYELLEEEKPMTWAESGIRSYLNTYFFQHTFSEIEKRIVQKKELIQEANSKYGGTCGRSTQDYVFLLSENDVRKYVPEKLLRAEIILADADYRKIEIEQFFYTYWLRTPGATKRRMCVVEDNGTINLEGMSIDTEEVGIRPAIWVDSTQLEKYQNLFVN